MENQKDYQEKMIRINEEAFLDASKGDDPRYPNDENYMQLYNFFKNMDSDVKIQ